MAGLLSCNSSLLLLHLLQVSFFMIGYEAFIICEVILPGAFRNIRDGAKKQWAQITRDRCDQFEYGWTRFLYPEHIKRAAQQAIDDNYSFYSPISGFPDLRKAIVEKLKKENGLDYLPSQIVVSNGAKQSICNVILSFH